MIKWARASGGVGGLVLLMVLSFGSANTTSQARAALIGIHELFSIPWTLNNKDASC